MSMLLRLVAAAAVAAGALMSVSSSATPPTAPERQPALDSTPGRTAPPRLAALGASGGRHEASPPADSPSGGLLRRPVEAPDGQGMAAEGPPIDPDAVHPHPAAGSVARWRALAVAEPGVYGMLFSGLAVLAMAARRRRKE